MFKILGVGALALALGACGAPRPRPPPPQNAPSAASPSLPAQGRIYRIDPQGSELRILVYRAGPLARFGHNHVMRNRAIRGEVNLSSTDAASSFSLTFPAGAFTVDEAQARREEGSDFSSEIPEDAKAGTFGNMMSTAVLDAAEFPEISVKSVAVATSAGAGAGTGVGGALTATVAIKVAGRESRVDVPMELVRDSDRVSASGSLELRQSALGLIPYSLMLGALQVQDAMTIKFKVVALLDAG